jgi:sugar phosphate isomerase/epimerase
MRLGASHLTYCTNVHPGEQLDDVLAALLQHTVAVKAAVCANAPFAIGLWLSRKAALELEQPARFAQLARLLNEHDLYVPTLNGFPFGAFHSQRVKESVYVPDWRDPARLEHTLLLARLLARLLPEGAHGSISTLPGGYKPVLTHPDDHARIADQLLACTVALHQLEQETGKRIALGLEPEPCCMLETIEETRSFFARHIHDERACARVAALAGTTRQRAEMIIARHLGVCLDACHAAVELEDPLAAVEALRSAQIPIVKLQLSAGLRVAHVDDAARSALAPYVEDTYLHQVVEQRMTPQGPRLRRYTDLPEALAAERSGDPTEWRIHFHVPVFTRQLGPFESTQGFLVALLEAHARAPISAHLEVETYTWGVLPEALRGARLADAIAREIEFCRAVLEGRAAQQAP